jgi:hypothetical protein
MVASTNTQLVNQRLALAQQAAAQGNYAAATAYASAAAAYSKSTASNQNIQNIINAYSAAGQAASQPTATTPASPAPSPVNTPSGPTPGDIAQQNYFDQEAAAAAAARAAAMDQNLSSAKAMIDSYGMGALWAGVDKYIRSGYTDFDTINSMLSQDSAYQQAYYDRFPAVKTIRDLNKQRISQGLAPIAEPTAKGYVELEKAYRQALVGLPANSFGNPSDVANWIVKDVSPTEVADRVTAAKNYIYYSANNSIKTQLRSIYGMTDAQMAAYVLSPDRALTQIQQDYQKRLAQATIGGAATDAGLNIADDTRDLIAQNEQFGQSYANTLSQMNSVKQIDAAYARLGRLSDVQTSTDDLVTEQFGLQGNDTIAEKRRNLASQERARFGGSSGIGRTSLSAGRLAQ